MSPPIISVIIPLYNKETIIDRTIRSVLSQSFSDFELIVVDDGSTDGSVRVVEGFHDERIRLINQRNSGPGAARNTGANNAKGDWIIFLDADDELREGALFHFFKLIKDNPQIEVFCCEFVEKKQNMVFQQYVYKDGIVQNDFKAWFFEGVWPRTGATAFSRNIVLKCPFNENIRRYEDLECVFRMFHHSAILLSHHIVLTQNIDFATASLARNNITEDFLGHLVFKGKPFWEKMCLYQFYLWERDNYPKEVYKLYPSLKWRYDQFFLYKALHFLKKCHVL